MNENQNNNGEIPVFAAEDIEKNKVISALAYIIFFLPLIACPDSSYGKFHANQALLLLIAGIAGNIIFSIIPFVGGILLPIYSLVVFILGVLGLVNAVNGKAQPLPIIGQYTIIK